MTREQKLALIVGFSLILLVGVLISDHLSSARKATIAKVDPEPAPVAPVPVNLAAAPNLDRPAIQPMPITQIPSTPDPASQPQTMAATDPARSDNSASGANPPVNPPVNPPINIARTNSTGGDGTLADEVRRLGGQMITGADGNTVISFPSAAATEPRAGNGGGSVREVAHQSPMPSPTITPVGPIENLKTHSVASGESLFQIAAKYYGNGNLWRDLAKFNGMDKSGAVRQGMKIKVPSKETLLGRTLLATPSPTSIDPGIRLIKPAPPSKATVKETAKPASTKPGKIELASYTVKRGDTLGDISKRTLGTSKRWQEILELNNLDDEDDIKTGVVLKLPAKKS